MPTKLMIIFMFFVTLCFAPFVSGEASTNSEPSHDEGGSSFSILSANVTSLRAPKRYTDIENWGATALVLQEVRLGPEAQACMRQLLDKEGLNVAFGKPHPPQSSQNKTRNQIWNAREGGIAVISSSPVIPVSDPHCDPHAHLIQQCVELYESTGFNIARIPYGAGHKYFYVASFHGIPKAVDGFDAELQRRLINLVFAVCSSFGDVLVATCMDANVHLDSSVLIQNILSKGYWKDAAMLAAGASPPPTFSKSGPFAGMTIGYSDLAAQQRKTMT